jgi:hypothetical protein
MSQSSGASGQAQVGPKPGKGQFKCFHCRRIFLSKDGDWHPWRTMEVHLCRGCEKLTQKSPERTGR